MGVWWYVWVCGGSVGGGGMCVCVWYYYQSHNPNML